MKLPLFIILLLFAAAAAGTAYPSPARAQPFDIYIALDNSASMAAGMSNITASLKRNIIDGFLCQGDNIHVLLFSSDVKVAASFHGFNATNDPAPLNAALDRVKTESDYSDYGRLLAFLSSLILTNKGHSRKLVLVLTDCRNEPATNSPYFTNRYHLMEALYAGLKPLRMTGADFYCLGIGKNTDVPVLAELLDTDLYEIPSPGGEELDKFLARARSLLTLEMNNNLGRFLNNKKMKVRLTSYYTNKVKTAFMGVYINEIKKSGVMVVTNSANLLLNPVSFEMDYGQVTNLELELAPLKSLPDGGFEGTMSFEMLDRVAMAPVLHKVYFNRGSLWWLYALIGLFLAAFFKSYIAVFIQRLGQTRAGVILKPLLLSYERRRETARKSLMGKPRLYAFLKTVSAGVDKAADYTVVYGVYYIRRFFYYFARAGVFILKTVSGFFLLRPFGFLFSKTGNFMLELDGKIQKLKVKDKQKLYK